MKEQTTFENMHEKRDDKDFPLKCDGFDEEDIRLLKEIMRDAYHAFEERKGK